MYFTGVLSLIIILVSGLFVGMVAAFAGLRNAADLRLGRGAGHPGGAGAGCANWAGGGALPVRASRAGIGITAEIGLMKATSQLSAMEMMAVDPIARVWRRASGPA